MTELICFAKFICCHLAALVVWSPGAATPPHSHRGLAVNVRVETQSVTAGFLCLHWSGETKKVSVHALVCGWVVSFWGLLVCCRGDQGPRVTSDPRTLGALREESFERGGCG